MPSDWCNNAGVAKYCVPAESAADRRSPLATSCATNKRGVCRIAALLDRPRVQKSQTMSLRLRVVGPGSQDGITAGAVMEWRVDGTSLDSNGRKICRTMG